MDKDKKILGVSCAALAVSALSVLLTFFFIFDVRKKQHTKTDRAQAKTGKEIQSTGESTGRVKCNVQTPKLTHERMKRGRAQAQAGIPPAEETKKEYYQQNDEAETEMLAPQPKPESAQPDSANGTHLFAEITALNSHKDEIEKIIKTKEPAIGFRVVREVMLMHTNELIPLL